MGKMRDAFNDRTADQLTRAGDPETSYSAGAKVLPKLRTLQQAVLDIHRLHPAGLTDFELEGIAGDHGSTYRTRRAELTELGLLINSGQKRMFGGRQRIVWRIAA